MINKWKVVVRSLIFIAPLWGQTGHAPTAAGPADDVTDEVGVCVWEQCECKLHIRFYRKHLSIYRLQSNSSAMIFSSSTLKDLCHYLVKLCDKLYITQTKQAIMDEKREIWRKPRQALHVLSMQCGTHRHTHSALLVRDVMPQRSESATVWPPRQANVIRLLVTTLQCF